jgi:hypothetical protein
MCGVEMNPRIRELAEQAGSTHKQNLGVYQFYTDELEKFAELIVRECAEFVDYRLTNPDGASMAWCDGSDIKEHFGVEL